MAQRVEPLHLHDQVVHELLMVRADDGGPQRERFESLLIHEMKPVAVGVHERGIDGVEVRLPEFFARLERFVEHGPREQVPHL